MIDWLVVLAILPMAKWIYWNYVAESKMICC